MPRLFDDMYAEDANEARATNAATASAAYQSSATPEVADIAAQLRQSYDWLTPGAALALAKGGVLPDHPAAQLAATQAAARKVDRGFGWHSIGDGLKAGVRGALTVLESGTQYVDALSRNVAKDVGQGDILGALGQVVNPMAQPGALRQTSLGIATEKLVGGEKVDLGTGFLPGGQVEEEQRARALAAYSIDGRAGTPGRILANIITEPGTKPYTLLSGLTDFAVDVYADPFAHGLGKSSKVRAAERSLVESTKDIEKAAAAGMVHGLRPAVITTKADQWLTTGKGKAVVDYLANEDDFYSLWRRFAGKIDAPLAARLVDAHTPGEVLDILRPELGIAIHDKPELGGLIHSGGISVRKRLEGVRLLGTMPARHIDINDVDQATNVLDRFLLNAKMPLDARKAAVERMAKSTDRIERYNIVTDSLQQVAAHIGGDPASAKRMTRMYAQYNERLAAYFLDEVGQNAPILGATIGGTNFALPVPHLMNEYILRALPLPDARDIRVATSRLKFIRDTAGVDAGVSALDFLSQDVWKPMVLLRGAWTVRVVGEEQVRMAAAGLSSIVNHPISAISWALGHKGAIGATGEAFADGAAAAGHLDQYAQALSRRGGGWSDRIKVIGRTAVRKDEEAFVKSWADELHQLGTDEIAPRVAGRWTEGDRVPGGLTGNHAEDTKRWFWEGPGKKFREELGQAHGREALLTDKRVADEYIDSIQKRIQIKAHGNSELVDAIASGRLNGELIRGNDLKSTKAFLDHLADLTVEGLSPEVVKGDLTVSLRKGAGTAFTDMKDKAVESMFSTLMSRPTNFLSRSPAFRQFYWQRAEELLPRMTREAQEATVRAARDAGLDRKTLRNMAKRMSVVGELDLDTADVVAKGFGLDKTRELLYDLSERSQFFDIARHIFPFGEAWKEVLTRWAKIGTENPEVIRRGQQAVQGARGSGFFHTDDQGNEVMSFPGTSFITRKITGVPVPMTGSVQGLNLFSKNPIMPGVGPVVQIAVGKLVPDKPAFEGLRNMILPYGAIDTEKGGGVVETFMPAWAQKVRQAWGKPTDARLFANTVMDVARYLESTGKYDLHTEEGKRALEDAARKKAKTIYMIRAAAQFFAPTAPTPEFVVQDKDGHALVATRLIELYRKMQDENYDTALDTFMDTFGENLSLLVQPKSEGTSPTNSAATAWAKKNGAIVRAYPEVYRFFAPQGGDFDFDAYSRSFETGERRALTPAEAMDRANDRIAGAVYTQAKSKFGASPNAQQRAVLKQLQDALIREFPGYEPVPLDMGATDRQVRQLESAAADPKLAKTEVGQALADYFAGRQMANDRAKAMGLTSAAQGKAARPLRDMLRGLADAITREHPEFAEVWDSVLSRELANDAEELPA